MLRLAPYTAERTEGSRFVFWPQNTGLILTNCGMDVTSVEINPFVVDLCKKNTAINSLDDETRVLEGSLYSPLRDDSCFSLVVVNPPLLPIPDEIPYPFV